MRTFVIEPKPSLSIACESMHNAMSQTRGGGVGGGTWEEGDGKGERCLAKQGSCKKQDVTVVTEAGFVQETRP